MARVPPEAPEALSAIANGRRIRGLSLPAAHRPKHFVEAVLEAQKVVRGETGEAASVVAEILDVLTRSKVQAWRAQVLKGRRLASRSPTLRKRAREMARKARRLLRRVSRDALSTEELEAELRSTWQPYLDARWKAREAEQWKLRAKRQGRVQRGQTRSIERIDELTGELWNEALVDHSRRREYFEDRLSFVNPSRSTLFGEAILEPLWAVIRKDGHRRALEDPISDPTLARLVYAIVTSYFEPELTKALTPDAIRKRVLKARAKKGEQ